MTQQGPYGHVFFSTTGQTFFNDEQRCVGCGCTAEDITANARCNGTHRYKVSTLTCQWCGLTMELIEKMARCTNDPDVGSSPGWGFGKKSGKIPRMDTSSQATVQNLTPEQRRKKISIITGLLAKTVARGATPEEAAAAHAKANDMLVKYGIDRGECVEQTKSPNQEFGDWLRQYAEAARRADEEAAKLREAERRAAQARADQERRNQQAREAYARAGYQECPHGRLNGAYCELCLRAKAQQFAEEAKRRQAKRDQAQEAYTTTTSGMHDSHVHFTVHDEHRQNRSHKNCTHASTKQARQRCRTFGEGYVP